MRMQLHDYGVYADPGPSDGMHLTLAGYTGGQATIEPRPCAAAAVAP
jgi:hypothetical protein